MDQPVEKRYWTSLEDRDAEALGAPPESDARKALHSLPAVDRRSFLKLLGFSVAAGALSGCARPVEKILPYASQPPEMTPGVANWYATTCTACPSACGALAKVMDGRPIKLEGNPEHALSRGGLCAAGQGSVMGLYSAHRQKHPARRGQKATWAEADRAVAEALAAAKRDGRKVALLTGTVTGPATQAVIQEFLAAHPGAEHVVYDAVSAESIREAHRMAYGLPVLPSYRFDRADLVVAFGADFLGTWISPVEFAKQYASRRDPDDRARPMCRHYQVEARMSLTGSNADVRLPASPSEQAACLGALVSLVSRRLGDAGLPAGLPTAPAPERLREPLEALAGELVKARGRSLIVCDSPDVSAQVAALALNELLGSVGTTVDLQRPSRQRQGSHAALARLLGEMQDGRVGVLLVHGCNPLYTWPQAREVEEALAKVPCSVALTPTPDETSARATWHCPSHHPMECWGDAEPQSGRLSLLQPTIRPLYDTRAFEESLLAWSGKPTSFHGYLQAHWQSHIFPKQQAARTFPEFWDAMLQKGYLELPVQAPPQKPLAWSAAAGALQSLARRPAADPGDVELEVFEPIALRDGSQAGNAWLQELPDPITKITWDNAALVSPSLAKELGLRQGQWLEVKTGGGTVRAPVHLQPGQHDRTISLATGYGRPDAGPIGSGVGVSAYPLLPLAGRALSASRLTALDPGSAPPAAFARTQIHGSMEGRPIVLETSLARYAAGEPVAETGEEHHAGKTDLWGSHPDGQYRWGMVVDLSKCIGCSGCVTSCDVENNVAMVGRDEVRRQREMHWLRIDRYFSGDDADTQVVHQPMMCQQCDNASCESVCPALATVHDDQGLNVQVYNRCVGTRYCANNCAYKVRRFNFLNHISNDVTQNLALNPDVTVRSRGVMEKCSLCIQRIQAARIHARNEGRTVRDGEVRTACEQSCPADAIIFGNLQDQNSRVSRLARSRRAYRVLEELNRQPGVYYLAKVRNMDEKEA